MDLPAKVLFDWLKYQGFGPWLAVRNKETEPRLAGLYEGFNPWLAVLNKELNLDWLDYEGFRVLSPND